MTSTVVCATIGCRFRSQSGFCTEPFVMINPNGTCGWCYDKRGKINEKWNFPMEQQESEKENASGENLEDA